MQGRLLRGIDQVPGAAWDALVPTGDPFVRHDFLKLLETSGSATPRTGWQPLHLVIEDGDVPVAAAPIYVKTHSWGEYVFDHGWADAFERAGGQYYPKLQAGVPFTPVPGPRLLGNGHENAREALVATLADLPEQLELSSLHVTFAAKPRRGRWQKPASCCVKAFNITGTIAAIGTFRTSSTACAAPRKR